MNTDIRVSVDFWDHHKTRKLIKKLGVEAAVSLQRIWMYAAKYRPDGNLEGMDEEDILFAAQFSGRNSGQFVNTLLELRWIDRVDGFYQLHDWNDHNSWVCGTKERSNAARFIRMAKTHPDLFKKLKEEGCTEISREDYEALIAKQRHVNAPFNVRSCAALTPAPAPAPAPLPKPYLKNNDDVTNYKSVGEVVSSVSSSFPSSSSVRAGVVLETVVDLLPDKHRQDNKLREILEEAIKSHGHHYVKAQLLYAIEKDPKKNFRGYVVKALTENYAGHSIEEEQEAERKRLEHEKRLLEEARKANEEEELFNAMLERVVKMPASDLEQVKMKIVEARGAFAGTILNGPSANAFIATFLIERGE
ncbi:MAG: hypothetical protein AAGU11_00870 [Syntrophobacteraceae bacterium]